MGTASKSLCMGYLSVVLHAHLPYIRYPEHEDHLEERWLYEAMAETYIPLLQMLYGLLNDDVNFRITISLSPTLTAMFKDSLLMNRFQIYLDRLIDLSEKEVFRTRSDRRFGPVARMYRKRLLKIRHLFEDIYGKDLTRAFHSLSKSGKVEMITSTATHAFLPAIITVPTAARAQIVIGMEQFRQAFGQRANGIWLPECGFTPEIDGLLKESCVSFFFLESHGFLSLVPQNKAGTYAPIKTPSGVTAFARDEESSKQVWSSIEGYPGDFDYRDFYRDIGFDLGHEYLKPYLPGGQRTFTGLKYYRITDKTGNKKPYIRQRALEKAKMHAAHFVKLKQKQTVSLREKLGIKPVITTSYDAELFGHWWFEGPEWLDSFFRTASGQKTFRLVSHSEYLSEHRLSDTAMPSLSSWGDKGYSSTWVESSNAWIYRHLHKAAKLMRELACANTGASGLRERALNQALRELLLAQASDWPFMMKTGNASRFAEKKFTDHIENCLALQKQVRSGRIRKRDLFLLEEKNNLFPTIDFRVYAQ